MFLPAGTQPGQIIVWYLPTKEPGIAFTTPENIIYVMAYKKGNIFACDNLIGNIQKFQQKHDQKEREVFLLKAIYHIKKRIKIYTRVMKLIKYIFIGFFILVVNHSGLSQYIDCDSTLIEAQKLFNQGMIEKIEEVLKPCFERGFTHNQRAVAYKLIIFVSLLNGDQAKAESTMLTFLHENPKYEIMPDDPVEFVYLFESFKTKSVFSVGFTIGPNFTNPSVKKSVTSGDANNTESSNKSGTGFQAGLAAYRHISQHLFLNIECYYNFNTYQFTDKFKKLGSFEENPDYDIVTYKEKISRIDVPLSLGFETQSRVITYYFTIGGSYSYLFKAYGKPSKEFQYNSEVVNGATKSVLSSRNQHLFFANAGFGTRIKMHHRSLSVDAKVNLGMNPIVIEKNVTDNTLIPDFQYIDDVYRVNTVSLSLGYFFSFYRTQKKQP